MLNEYYNNISNYLSETLGTTVILVIVVSTSLLSLAYLILMGYVIARMESTYFIQKDITNAKVLHPNPERRLIRTGFTLAVELVKVIIGFCLLIAGIIMLVLPGQGIITILIGLSLLPFPGKDKLVSKLLSKKSVRSSLNWLRTKAKKDPFIFD